MRSRIEGFVRRWWAGELGWAGAALSLLTAPLSRGWAGVTQVRASRALGHGTRIEGLVVVSVGNLAVGGTGKTPMSAWVAQRLRSAGARTSILVGGQASDEARLHALWNSDVPVIKRRDRVSAAAKARSEGAQAVVLDDGFQHLRLARDLDVVLISAEDPFPAATLPSGPYREAPAALGRADAVVVTRRTATEKEARALAERAARFAPAAASAGARLAQVGLQSLDRYLGLLGRADGAGREEGSDGRGVGPVLAVCAVARPDAFGRAVARSVNGPVELCAFADHHEYTMTHAARLRRRAGGRPIVVTGKDAVKLEAHREQLGDVLVLAEELSWEWGEADVAALLDALVREAVRR